jgi:hypothetical protein
MSLYTHIDKFLIMLFHPSDYKKGLDNFRVGLQGATHTHQDLDVVFKLMDAVDAKSAALLTHISLIFAVLSITYASLESTSAAFARIILIEIVVYLLITILCLRCITMTSFKVDKGAMDTEMQTIEVFNRLLIYNICNKAAFLATSSLIPLFISKLLYR